MIAETAYNVIQSLPKEELERLFNMLQVIPLNPIPKPKRKKERPIDNWTVERLTEILQTTLFNKKKQ